LEKNEEQKYIETDIVINLKTGEIFLSRDHEDMVAIAKTINPDSLFEKFFNEKPKDLFGRKNYNSFCG